MLLLLQVGFSCRKKVEPTKVTVEDPDRHYYPLLQGEELVLVYNIKNEGPSPLVIGDIQPSCGCINLDQTSNIILPDQEGVFRFKYISSKNVGLASHTIRMYGNIAPKGMLELKFDVNVVPHADYTRDYEELYKEYVLKNSTIEELVNGKSSEKGYYVDIEKDSRSHKIYPWREE